MSVLNNSDLHTPLGSLTIQKVKGIVVGVKSHQATAADATEVFVATQPGKLLDVYVVLAAAFHAVVENMDVNVLVNGVSKLTGGVPVNLTAATAIKTQVKLPFIADTQIATGDTISIVRNWTTGGGGVDTTPASVVGVEWADRAGTRV
jgi:hypothetical protein